MGYCRNCGTKLEDDMAYCPKCGTPVAVPSESYRQVRHEHYDGGLFGGLALAAVATVIAAGVIIIALLAVGLLPGISVPFGQVGSGNVTTQQVAITDFTGVDAGYGFNVKIMQGSTYSVNIITDDNLQQYVDAHKSGSTLTVRLKGIGVTTSTLRAEITMPDVQNVEFSGGVVATASGFNLTHDFNVGLSGGSSFTMTGSAANLRAEGSGGSNLHFGDFQVNNANVDLSGGSQGTINATGRVDANLGGGAHLYYRGNPTLGNIDSSSGAGISKID